MTEPSLEEQVRTLQAQLAAANARISYLESEAVILRKHIQAQK
jgi:hypothetical protein